MVPVSVAVPLVETRRGRSMFRYAADLATRLKVPLFRDRAFADSEHADVLFATGTVLVAEHARRRGVTTVVPFDETAVDGRGPGEAMFPLGNGPSGLYAVEEGLPVAKALRLPVVFYHTTWRDSEEPSTVPGDHACERAKDVLRRAAALADRLGIKHRSVIELADGVVDGALLRALTERCLLLVVARGEATGRGSYVDQWLEKSPIPVLVMGRKEEPR